MLTADENALFNGALDVAVQLAASDNDGHKGIGQIIAGLCAMIVKREPEGSVDIDGQGSKPEET